MCQGWTGWGCELLATDVVGIWFMRFLVLLLVDGAEFVGLIVISSLVLVSLYLVRQQGKRLESLIKPFDGSSRYQGVENPSHKKLKQILGKTKRFDSFQVNLNQSKTMEMGGPGKGVFRMYDHQKKLSSSKPSRNKPSSSKPSAMPSRYLRMQDEEIHVEEPRHSFSPPQSHGRRVRTRNHDEEYLQEHDHEGEISCSFSPPQSHGRRVRIRNQNEECQQEQDYEGDSVQTGTYMSDDEEDNIGSTSHDKRLDRTRSNREG